MWQDLFQSGSLLLPESPSPAVLPAETGLPLPVKILTLVFVLLLLMQFKRFFSLVPSLWDSVFRARGSFQLENSYRLSHDRTVLAHTFLLPAVLLAFRYRLYDPAFLQGVGDRMYLVWVVGVILDVPDSETPPQPRQLSLVRTHQFYFLHPPHAAGSRDGRAVRAVRRQRRYNQVFNLCGVRVCVLCFPDTACTNSFTVLQSFPNFFVPLRPGIFPDCTAGCFGSGFVE